jgi:hypothetical protein|tara:strand:- start:55 stop:303 length:249 start_codon:yes stop_codon:yes gene_type:complete
MPKCSLCGVTGHNKTTCHLRTGVPKSSAFHSDYKKQVKQNYNYLKTEQKKQGKTGPVFPVHKSLRQKKSKQVAFFKPSTSFC